MLGWIARSELRFRFRVRSILKKTVIRIYFRDFPATLMRATSKNSNVSPPVPPVRPDNDECCHSGCEPCIFDLYEIEMEKYRAALKEWEKNQVSGDSK